jgi:hypothetical protein
MDDAVPHKNVEINDARLQFIESTRPDQVDDLDTSDLDPDELVEAEDACPRCGERHIRKLVWQEDNESIRCGSCGASYGFKK